MVISFRKAVRATLILIPLLGLQFVLTPFRPETKSTAESVYEIVSAIVTSLQVSFGEDGNGIKIGKKLYLYVGVVCSDAVLFLQWRGNKCNPYFYQSTDAYAIKTPDKVSFTILSVHNCLVLTRPLGITK